MGPVAQTGHLLPREHPCCPHRLGDRDTKHGETRPRRGRQPWALLRVPRGGVSAPGCPRATLTPTRTPGPGGAERAPLRLTGLASTRVGGSPPGRPWGLEEAENVHFQPAPGDAPSPDRGPRWTTRAAAVTAAVTEEEASGANPDRTPAGSGPQAESFLHKRLVLSSLNPARPGPLPPHRPGGPGGAGCRAVWRRRRALHGRAPSVGHSDPPKRPVSAPCSRLSGLGATRL